MENINDYIEKMNFLETKLCSLGKENKEYDKYIKQTKKTRNFGIVFGTLLIPYLTYFIKAVDLTAFSNVYLMTIGIVSLGSVSYTLIRIGVGYTKKFKEAKNICEKDITETEQLLKEITIKYDNCLTNNLEKTNVTSYENNQNLEIENTNKKAKTYTKILKKDNE